MATLDDIKKLFSLKSDEELIKIYEEEPVGYSQNEIDLAGKELLKRNYKLTEGDTQTDNQDADSTILSNPLPAGEIFTEYMVNISSVLGGPLAATYFLATNFKTLGKRREANQTWLFGIMATMLFFALIQNLSEINSNSSTPKLLQILWIIPTYFILQKYQKIDIDNYLKSGGKTSSGWKVFGYSTIAVLITFGLFAALNLAFDDPGTRGFD